MPKTAGVGPRIFRGLLFGTTIAWGVIFLVLVVLAQRRHEADPTVEVMFPAATSSGQSGAARLMVEVVDTPAARTRGLMGRRRLLAGHGMLFVFPEPGRYGFWMKNTHIPLDIIWISPDKRVVHLAERLPPCPPDPEPCPTVEPPGKIAALYVVEAEAGFVRNAGITVGALVVLPDIRAAR